MDSAELIDRVAKILRLLQREFDQYIEEHDSPWVTEAHRSPHLPEGPH